MVDLYSTNLPLETTSLLGREAEIAAALELQRRPETRLLTFTGPAGVGKTRLAVALAMRLFGDYEHGVFFVQLATIRDPRLVVSTIAQVLGLKETADRTPQYALREFLGDRQLLLLLDTFEHVLESTPLVADLLAAAEHVRVIVTSRVALDLPGEQVIDVPPLPLPSEGEMPALEELGLVPSVALFVQRARSVRSYFELTAENAAAVAAICSRLDGLPLAIELAAAQTWFLSPELMLPRLAGRLQLLSLAGLAAPNRRQTLRTALAWSYELLDDRERSAFRRLAVFAGGCTVEAAGAVLTGVSHERRATSDELRAMSYAPEVTDNRQPVTGNPVLSTQYSVLDALVRKSLLRRGEGRGDELRFWMLDTIREYGLEELAESGELSAAQQSHALYYLDLAERAALELTGAEQRAWLDRLEEEHDNLRAALSWALDQEEAETAVRFGAALWRFWWTRGHLGEGRRWLQAALSEVADTAGTAGSLWAWRPAPPAMRAAALRGAGILARNQCDYAEAAALLDESLALFRRAGDAAGVANALNSLGLVALDQGDYAMAADYFQQSLDIEREQGDKQRVAVSLNNLGGVALYSGDYARAEALYEESLALRREMDDRWGIANSLVNLGEVAYYQEQHGRAADLLIQSLNLQLELGEKRGIAACLEKLAAVTIARGDPARAARLCGAAENLREQIAAPLPAHERAVYERTIAAGRAALGEEIFDLGRAAGRGLRLNSAVAEAIRG